MRPIVIRRVDITDALVQATITALHAECYHAVDNPYHPTQGHWWLALDGKDPVAFAGIMQSQQDKSAGYLCRAGVLPAYRGRGLQVRLIRKRLAFARTNRWSHVVTDTRRNPASSNSLIKCGFRLFEPQYTWSFSDALYWRRNA